MNFVKSHESHVNVTIEMNTGLMEVFFLDLYTREQVVISDEGIATW